MANTDFNSLNPITAPAPTFYLLIQDPSLSLGPAQFERITCDNFMKLVTKLVADKTIRMEETTGVVGLSGQGMAYFDSGSHALSVSENNGTVDQVALIAKNQTFTNKTLTSPVINTPTITTPTIASGQFVNAQHNHSDAAHGGALNSLISPGSKKNANITFNAEGRITAASDGTVDPFTTITYAATLTPDASAGNAFEVTLTGNLTLNGPTSPTNNQVVIFRFIQGSGGSHLLTLTTSAGGFNIGTTITSTTLSTTVNKCDYMTCIYQAASNFWHVVGFSAGFTGA